MVQVELVIEHGSVVPNELQNHCVRLLHVAIVSKDHMPRSKLNPNTSSLFWFSQFLLPRQYIDFFMLLKEWLFYLSIYGVHDVKDFLSPGSQSIVRETPLK